MTSHQADNDSLKFLSTEIYKKNSTRVSMRLCLLFILLYIVCILSNSNLLSIRIFY